MTCQEAAEFLRTHDNYLIITHKRPDGDAIGCSVALAEMLRAIGKTAWLLPSLDATDLFTDYLAGQTAPEGYAPDTVVTVDLASLGLLPPNGAPWKDAVQLAIDHHPSNDGYAARTCLEGDKAACGEILYHIAQLLGVMSPSLADMLYVAVSTDTGCFVYSNVTANTHRVAAALMEAGANYKYLNKKHFRTKSLPRLRLEQLMVEGMRLSHGDSVAVAPVSLAMMAAAGAGENDAEDIAAVLGQIKGVRHSATIRELKPGECKISLRTAADLNASRVCARLGGGGHAAAAGCTVNGSVEDAERAILAAIDAEMAEHPHG